MEEGFCCHGGKHFLVNHELLTELLCRKKTKTSLSRQVASKNGGRISLRRKHVSRRSHIDLKQECVKIVEPRIHSKIERAASRSPYCLDQRGHKLQRATDFLLTPLTKF